MNTLLDIHPKPAKLIEAIEYGRYSDKEQGEGDSRRRQTEGAEHFAQTYGLKIVRRAFDGGLSAFHGDHIKYGKLGGLLQEIKDGKIKPGTVLLVECIDRLSREAPCVQFTLLVQILSAGIQVVTFQDNKWYTLDSINEHPHELFGVLGIMARGNDDPRAIRKGQDKLGAEAPADGRGETHSQGPLVVKTKLGPDSVGTHSRARHTCPPHLCNGSCRNWDLHDCYKQYVVMLTLTVLICSSRRVGGGVGTHTRQKKADDRPLAVVGGRFGPPTPPVRRPLPRSLARR